MAAIAMAKVINFNVCACTCNMLHNTSSSCGNKNTGGIDAYDPAVVEVLACLHNAVAAVTMQAIPLFHAYDQRHRLC